MTFPNLRKGKDFILTETLLSTLHSVLPYFLIYHAWKWVKHTSHINHMLLSMANPKYCLYEYFQTLLDLHLKLLGFSKYRLGQYGVRGVLERSGKSPKTRQTSTQKL